MADSPSASAPRSRRLHGVALTTAGVVVLSPDGLLTTLVAADPWTQVFWRGLLMGLALTLACFLRRAIAGPRRTPRPSRGAQALVGVFFAVSSIGWVVAIVNTSVANTLFLVASAPLFAAIVSRVVLGERIAPRTVVAIAAAIAGMAIIFAEGLGRGDMVGNLAALLTALSWAGMAVTIRAAQIDDPAPALAGGAGLIALVGLVAAPTLAIVPLDMVWLGLLGLVVLPLSFFLIGKGPRHLPAPEVGLIMLLEAVLGPLWAWAAIGQTPSVQTLAGGILILGTLAVHFAGGMPRKRKRRG